MKNYIQGKIIEQDGALPARITIEDDLITDVEPLSVRQTTAAGETIYDLDQYLIFPGFIDIHTHCREDVSGLDCHKEDYPTVGLAALSGGVTCIADMPNNPIVPLDHGTYAAKRQLVGKCPVDVLLYAGVGPTTRPFGVYPYKVFMGPSTRSEDALHFADTATLSVALAGYAGQNVSFHCEDPVILDSHRQEASHERRRPSIAEIVAIDTACALIKDHHLLGKICHVSTPEGLTLIRRAKQQGVTVECEVTPHHLYFDQDMFSFENRRFLQMNPPIRSRTERLALLEELRNDHFDYLASDHAPHTTAEKMKGISGVPELDTYGAFVTWLLVEQKISPQTIFRMACKNPGEWVKRFWPGRKIGRIVPGYEASLTVLNLTKPPVESRSLFTRCGWSPFDLRALPGSVQTVYLRGEKVIDGLYVREFKSGLSVAHSAGPVG